VRGLRLVLENKYREAPAMKLLFKIPRKESSGSRKGNRDKERGKEKKTKRKSLKML